jgi:S-adenosylmethionine/arginine decarboxylase-like enzyme
MAKLRGDSTLLSSDGAAERNINDELDKIGVLNEQKADVAYLETVLSNVLDGSPTGTFTTLAALRERYPNGASGVFLVLEGASAEAGHIYYWDGTVWQDAGVYQGIELKDGSLTLPKTSNSIGLNQFPFHSRATISSNETSASEIRSAIKSLTLLNADVTKKYAITDFKRNSSGIWRLDIFEVTDNALITLVARFNSTTYVEPNGITQVALTEQNSSGISGFVVIDWSQVSEGNYALSTVDKVYSVRGLDIRTYIENFIPDKKITTSKLAEESVTMEKTSSSLGYNQYPFHPRASISPNLNTASQIKNALKGITLLNADITKKYAMTDLKRNSNGVWRIDIYEVTDNSLITLVARFNATSYVEPSGIAQLELLEQNASGIHGVALVEWSKLSPGNYALSTVAGVYASRGLDISTYTTNLDGSITSKMFDDLLGSYNYPFKDGSTFGYTRQQALQVKGAIKNVHLYGANYNKEYAVIDIKRNNSNRWRVDVWEVNGRLLINQVALFHVDNYMESSNLEKIFLNEVNNSGITAEVVIDWDALSDGFSSSDTVYAAERNLSVLTYCEKKFAEEFFATAFPPRMYLVPGKEVSIYYDAVTLCDNVEDYTFISSGGGENQSERVVLNYDRSIYDAGHLKDFTTTVEVYKGSNLKSTEKVEFKVVNPDSGAGVTKKVLIIGDSTTDQNFAVKELLNNFENDVMNIELLGTRGTAPALHEGHSGWSAIDFLNKASYNNRDNAFFNPETQAFDFNYYMGQQGYTNVDHVIINLGINDSHTSSNYDEVMKNFNTMIDNIKLYDPNITVGVCITISNAKLRPGIYPIKKEQVLIAQKIIETFQNRESEGIYLIPMNANIDTVRGFKYEEVPASSRSTEIVKRCIDGLHLNNYTGYPQQADTYFCYLKSRE